MAGFYPDVPGHRFAWDVDGSTCLQDGTPLSQGNMTALNSGTGFTPGSIVSITVAFPQKRDIVGATFGEGSATTNATVWTSVDTTNGIDGTWVQQTTTFQMTRPQSQSDMRLNIRAVSYLGIRGIRFRPASIGGDRFTSGPHLYGNFTAGETRWLIFTDTGGTEVTPAYFDFADDPRGGNVEVKQFKIKNGHGSLTANTITVGPITALAPEKSPVFADDYTLSLDGGVYASSISVGTLAPGASSGTLHLKRTTPLAAATGAESAHIVATAASWS